MRGTDATFGTDDAVVGPAVDRRRAFACLDGMCWRNAGRMGGPSWTDAGAVPDGIRRFRQTRAPACLGQRICSERTGSVRGSVAEAFRLDRVGGAARSV